MRYSAKIILRQDRLKANGTASLMLQAFINGKKKMIALDISCWPDCWDPDAQQVRAKRKGVDAKSLNIIVGNAKIKAESIFNDFRIRDCELSPEIFVRLFRNPERRLLFVPWSYQWLEQQKGLYASDTMRSYRSTIRSVEMYRPDTAFADLNIDWVLGYEKFLRSRGVDVSTIGKRHTHLKHIINMLRREYAVNQPYADYRIKRPRGVRTYLLTNEVRALQALFNSNSLSAPQHRCLRAFLFMCETGLRHSDANRVTWNHVQDGFIRFRPQKTEGLGKSIQVPLTPEALQFCSPVGHLIDADENQVFNRNMKEVARLAGIKKQVTAHVARHTFATAFLAKGGSIEVLQRILGHTNISTTQVYVHVADERLQLEGRTVMGSLYT